MPPLLCAKLPASEALGEGRTGSAEFPGSLLPVKRGQDLLQQVGEFIAAWRASFGGNLQVLVDRTRDPVHLPESYFWRIRALIKLALASERPPTLPARHCRTRRPYHRHVLHAARGISLARRSGGRARASGHYFQRYFSA